MEYSILICLVIIIFLLWGNNNKFISSSSNDWMILVRYKEFKDLDLDGKVKDKKIIDNEIFIQFIPIIGWKYNDSKQYGKLTPITPPIYRVKDRLHSSDGEVRMSYWIRDGKEYEISSEWTSGNDFWEDLVEYHVLCGREIVITSKVPDSLQSKVQQILELKNNNKE